MDLMNDDDRWQAVLDRRGEGFVYGVVTTGVYCRPSCPSRRPRRENVRFFPSPADAEQAGLRACRRCGVPDERPALVAQACTLLDDADLTLAEVASAVGMSPYHFHRVFKAETGITPKAYAAARRAERARRHLDADQPVTDAIYAAGFGSNGRFYAESTERLGMTPSQYRAGGADAHVRFAVGECDLGSILVATTDKGVCAIELGDDPDELVRSLQDRFHAAELVGDDAEFDELVARVVALVEHPTANHDLPIDVRGTAFQERVWQALRQIPAGETTTYSKLAVAIGAPTSTRAVAGACAANHVAVAIPCHRVVRTDGSLSGYRWGVERKAALLEREASNAAGVRPDNRRTSRVR